MPSACRTANTSVQGRGRGSSSCQRVRRRRSHSCDGSRPNQPGLACLGPTTLKRLQISAKLYPFVEKRGARVKISREPGTLCASACARPKLGRRTGLRCPMGGDFEPAPTEIGLLPHNGDERLSRQRESALDDGTPATRASLLLRFKDSQDRAAWKEFVEIYGPLVYDYGRRHGFRMPTRPTSPRKYSGRWSSSAGKFRYDPSRGSFRSWLFTVSRTKRINLGVQGARQPQGSGASDVFEQLKQIPAREADDSESDEWDRAFEQRLLDWAAGRIRSEFKESTWRAFTMTALEGASAQSAAAELGSPSAPSTPPGIACWPDSARRSARLDSRPSTFDGKGAEMPPRSTCPDPSRLEAFRQGTLPPGEETALVDHLDDCPGCREYLDAPTAAADFPAGMKPSAGPVSPAPEAKPAFRRALAALRAAAAGSRGDGPVGAGLRPGLRVAHPRWRSVRGGGCRPDRARSLELHATGSLRASRPCWPVRLSPEPGSIGLRTRCSDVVGRGGMGVVLKAHDAALNRIVAIKVLAPALASDPVRPAGDFTREARAAAAVCHEHVVNIHSVPRRRNRLTS